MESFKVICALITFLSRTYLLAVACLTLWVLIPLVLMWTPTAVISGSMEPTIMTGDVLAAQKVTESQVYSGAIKPGMIVLASDPMKPDTLFTHRVIEVLPDKSMITKGDANATPDPIALPVENVRGIERLRIPFIGHPVQAVYSGNFKKLALITLSLLASLVILSLAKDPEEQDSAAAAPTKSDTKIRETKTLTIPRFAMPKLQIGSFGISSAAASVVLAVVLVAYTGSASASFTGNYERTNNSWTASGSFPTQGDSPVTTQVGSVVTIQIDPIVAPQILPNVTTCGLAVYTTSPGITIKCNSSAVSGKTFHHTLTLTGVQPNTPWSITTDWSNVPFWLQSRAAGSSISDTGEIFVQKGYQITGYSDGKNDSEIVNIQVRVK